MFNRLNSVGEFVRHFYRVRPIGKLSRLLLGNFTNAIGKDEAHVALTAKVAHFNI